MIKNEQNEFIELANARVLARGSQRICYEHPGDPTKCIKVNFHPTGKQHQRELAYLAGLARRRIPARHMPVFFGTVNTSQGIGLVVSRIADYDGVTSTGLDAFIRAEGCQRVLPALEELKAYYHRWNIITCDMSLNNFLVRRVSPTSIELVMIDGLGNREFLAMSSRFALLGRLKMKRRWKRFDQKLAEFT